MVLAAPAMAAEPSTAFWAIAAAMDDSASVVYRAGARNEIGSVETGGAAQSCDATEVATGDSVASAASAPADAARSAARSAARDAYGDAYVEAIDDFGDPVLFLLLPYHYGARA